MNRIRETIRRKNGKILNVYFTAGHPEKSDMLTILTSLEECGVDLVEIGMPYSDPLADGLTIQKSSERALRNGITLEWLFDQIKLARQAVKMPFILMGYFNQMLQYGVENFLKSARESGVDGLIIPDLPMDVYQKQYLSLFNKYGMAISFLITPQTSSERINQADRLSSAFVYVVAQTSITGGTSGSNASRLAYYQRIKNMHLKSPTLIGFGIHDSKTYKTACQYADGAIVGSAFIRAIDQATDLQNKISSFVEKIRI